MPLSYDDLRRCIAGERLPALVVDLDAFDRNLDRVLALVEPSGLAIRVATKSLRVPELLGRLFDRAGRRLRGLMCWSVEEAALLAREGYDDLFVAYPPVQARELDLAAALTDQGIGISIAFDDVSHLERLARAGEARGVRIRGVLCADMSVRLWNDRVHLGVRRSPVATPEDAVSLARAAAKMDGVVLRGVMGYEAQIAGLPDGRPSDPARWAKRAVRAASVRTVRERRAAIVAALRADGHDVVLVNGGGTGSLDTTMRDPTLTELTCGSAFFKPHLFDHFTSAHVKELEPACYFVLEVSRVPAPSFATCLGGGYVASGPPGPHAVPLPWFPAGLSYLDGEWAGEVQTPLRVPDGVTLAVGDPVVFRHAKAGEVAERFKEALLLADGRVVDRAPTYRGLGACFF